ncbi:hypothetical protein GCM10027421_28600 [Microbacterium shaanxiense]
MCPVELLGCQSVQAQRCEFIQPRHEQPGPALTYADDLRRLRIMHVKEVAGIVPSTKLCRVLPKDLVYDVITVQVQRRGRDPVLWLCPTERVRCKYDDITDVDVLASELAEETCGSAANDNELHAVIGDRIYLTVKGLRACTHRNEEAIHLLD